MAKKVFEEDQKVKEIGETFIKSMDSNIDLKCENPNSLSSFDWVNEIEFALTYLDNIVRKPRVILVSQAEVNKIERAKKITVESVKNLARNTSFIDKIDDKTGDVQPSKILEVFNEESFNTYENRFIYTIIDMINKFVAKKEKTLDELEDKSSSTLRYEGKTNLKGEAINIKMQLNSTKNMKSEGDESEINKIKERIKKIKQYLNIWAKSELITSLTKARVSLVVPPIKKTNLILKNPNFQIATKLWEFLYSYDLQDKETDVDLKENNGTSTMQSILDETFFTQYSVLEVLNNPRKLQKEELAKYASTVLIRQIKSGISTLLNCGVKITDEEILSIIADEIKNERMRKIVGKSDVKKKFKDMMSDYLENTQNYL